jgi:uncharacterized protein (TIGR02231 family)
LLFAFICFSSPLWLFATENEQATPSTITNVTVFLNQAQVTRMAKVDLQAGITNLVFDKVSPFINLNSIQVKTENNVTLLSVSQRNNYLAKKQKPQFILDIEDTIESINNQLQLLNIKQEAWLLEKDVLIANKQIGGVNSGVKIDELEDALILFRKRSQEVGEELFKISTAEKKLIIIRQRFQVELVKYNNNENSTAEIVVTVKTLTAVSNAKIEWDYIVNNASWKPFYDVRVKDTKSELQLASKAYITQGTGESWKNVVLKLSTANPNENGSKPALQTHFLQFNNPAIYGNISGTVQEEISLYNRKALAAPASDDKSSYSAGVATTQQTDVNIEFQVTSAYTIPSDNTPHQVDLTVSNLQAIYAYAAVPKLDKNAFVTAKVAGNDLANQVSGEANVYFDGTFVGKTYINGTTSDSMILSLGRDKRIQIQRTQLKDFSSKTIGGSSKKELNTWEISLRNTRKEPVSIIVEDQIPVSTDKEIEIKLIQNGGAEFDESTGKLKWTILLDAEKSQTVKFSFEVKYPKDKIISDY